MNRCATGSHQTNQKLFKNLVGWLRFDALDCKTKYAYCLCITVRIIVPVFDFRRAATLRLDYVVTRGWYGGRRWGRLRFTKNKMAIIKGVKLLIRVE